jgi:lincosamide nucleotidyltransferase A/C/D/E
VFEVLSALDARGIAWWVAGGWGVDALVGEQTRAHRDLDLLVAGREADAAIDLLGGLGYVRETDGWPVRAEYVRPDGRCVDLHPLTFHDDGSADQPGLEGECLPYPAAAFSIGRIGDRTVPCLSAEQQRAFHSGYEPRERVLHDLGLLDGRDHH